MMTFETIATITGGSWITPNKGEGKVTTLLIDSRKASYPVSETLFFAISGIHHDGHKYIEALYRRGVRMFIVTRDISSPGPEAAILKVADSVRALQQVALQHRAQFKIPVVGITGSNGKTIVKEWLGQLLAPYRKVIKSPGSFNSQIGVPLSVWQMGPEHEIALIEAGISQSGEMERLQKIIRPTIGIFTNIGSAHDEGFASREEKIREKMKLFSESDLLIYRRDHEDIHRHAVARAFTWGKHQDSDIIFEEEMINGEKVLHLDYEGYPATIRLPFNDDASVENAMHCIAFLVHAGFTWAEIAANVQNLRHMHMRLELKRGQNNSFIIDDTYNNDLAGLKIALDFLSSQPGAEKKTLIISDILQSGRSAEAWIGEVRNMSRAAGVNRLIAVGPQWMEHAESKVIAYPDTDSFLSDMENFHFEKEFILVKGARSFQLEKVVRSLEEKIHGTVLEVNLDALTNNLNFYRSRLRDGVKVMVMVKAFAYGSGSIEIANLLEFNRVDYLGVAYADEGVHLRKHGIQLPVMVMNPSPDSFETMLTYRLEPEIYNLRLLEDLIHVARGREVRIHLKIDTGMRRLGFEKEHIDELLKLLKHNGNIRVASIYSHLAGADAEEHEEFSRRQAAEFTVLADIISSHLDQKPVRHLLNSPGIIRFPEYQFDMVRLGIGLYGVEASQMRQDDLQPISRLHTVISQIKHISKGETVGYSRRGVAERDSVIATIAIGYADGFSRAFSNGKGRVWVNHAFAPVIGNVCMDMTMIDITGIDAHEGDEVEIFGPHISIMEMAQTIGTIPYEILTNVSQRVRRVFFST